jgi:hypothetical protein
VKGIDVNTNEEKPQVLGEMPVQQKARERRAEATLSPQGGGSRQSPPQKAGTARHQEQRGSPDQTKPKGSARDDRRPQSWRAQTLNSPQGGHANRTPTPGKRNRKEPDPMVNQNNSSLAQTGTSIRVLKDCFSRYQIG